MIKSKALMIKSKKQMFIVICAFILVMLLGTVTYAFFNYTRIGSSNTIRVGRIFFNTTQNNSINLSNVFPTDANNLNNTNSGTVTVNITGDTTYEEGIEYKVSLVEVNNVVNNKEVPISFSVETNNLGTKSNDYYNDRGSTTNVYNLVETGNAENDKMILVGYIKPDSNGVNGSIDITAYLDKEEVGISDTVSRIENNNLVYGETPGDWIAGRTILTTSEWNSLQTNGISFKVKVEANEGIWVEEPKIFVMRNLMDEGDSNWQSIRTKVTSIEFSTNSAIPDNAITSFDATDITSEGPVTVYTLDDELGNNTYKVVICADDVIYAPESSTNMFAVASNLVSFNSENFRVDNVIYFTGFFVLCKKLENVYGLSEWNTSNARYMGQLFHSTQIDNVDFLINWNTSNVESMSQMFEGCSNLVNINGLVNWDTSKVTNMSSMFRSCTNLTDLSGLINWNTSKVTNMRAMFRDGTIITSYQMFKDWDVGKVEDFSYMFNLTDSSTVTTLNGLENWNVSSAVDMQYMFRGNINLTDASAINNWDINKNINFTNMFYQDLVHPEFTRVQGTWDSNGTFTPNS